MSKSIGLAISIVVCFLLAGALIQNYRSQRATENRLDDLQKKIDRQSARAPGEQATSIVVQNATTLPTEYAQRHQQVLEVMAAGWKMIAQRSPEPAQHAADLFQAALETVDPRSPDLYNGLGRALLIAGKPREAIAAWRKGLELAPQFAEMQSGIGWGYWHLNSPFYARQAWQAATEIDPQCADAWAALAWIDLAMGDQESSKRGFQALLEHDNRNMAWIQGLSMAKAGNTRIEDIDHFFKLPPLGAFDASAPDPVPAAETTTAAASNSPRL